MAVNSSPRNIFTVDLEEWFHVCGVGGPLSPENWDRLPSRVEETTVRVLDILDRANVRATFFVLGWIADRYPRLVDAVRAAGHEIGSHGYSHQRAYDLGVAGFRDDLRKAIGALTAIGVPSVTTFRAPEWSINERSLWALPTLVGEGIKVDASMAPVRIVGSVNYPRYPCIKQTVAGPITEVPPLVVERLHQVMPIGWGWGLRMSSPRRVLRSIEAVNRAGLPAVLTIHPWELDPDPPRVRLPLRLHFAHYFQLSGFRERLCAVLAGTAFSAIGDMATIGLPREQ